MQGELTDCELLVMKIIWGSKEPLSIQEIMARIEQAYHRDWKIQTVSTFLRRAVKKECLSMKRQGRSFYYYPLVSESEYGQKEIAKCVEFWGNGRVDVVLAYFVAERRLTKEEKENIRKLIDGIS